MDKVSSRAIRNSKKVICRLLKYYVEPLGMKGLVCNIPVFKCTI